MMGIRRGLAAVATLLLLLGCQAASPAAASGETREAAIQRAHALYASRISEGAAKETATREAAALLRKRPDVRDAEITGSDSVLVTFTDGERVMVLLGSGRL